MAFRFRKSFKVLPGVRLNLSKSGTSLSVGGRGATLNVGGKNGPRTTVGIPGTGISYTERVGEPAGEVVPTAAEPMPQNNGERALNTAGQVLGVVLKVAGWLLLIAVVFFAALMALGGSGKKSRY
jgi:hypothetical protein